MVSIYLFVLAVELFVVVVLFLNGLFDARKLQETNVNSTDFQSELKVTFFVFLEIVFSLTKNDILCVFFV